MEIRDPTPQFETSNVLNWAFGMKIQVLELLEFLLMVPLLQY